MAQRILVLLEDGALLSYYCAQGKKRDCYPISRVSGDYPARVYDALELESPGCLWYKGDVSILQMPAVALVGSRDLSRENREFAREVGRQAALQGYVLVSGNARGADQEAQNACLAHGGYVISVVADSLAEHGKRDRVLYLSEDEFAADFSAARALSRNRVIHALGQITFVAQCGYQTGGTWDGTVKNLRFGYSPVFCFADGSPAQKLLEDMGADIVTLQQMQNFDTLQSKIDKLF
jgi:predicted Rossmann fold nucleotide-binding protein DprA/Smf involved in DNA uptake